MRDMVLALRFSRVLPAQIDFADETFNLLPRINNIPKSLLKSVSRVGILHPPLLRMGNKGSYQLLKGRQRILAAIEKLHWSHIPARIIPADTPDIDALALTVEEILACRNLSPAEIAAFCKKIQQWTNSEEESEKYLPLAGLNPDSRTLERYSSLTDLEEPILIALHTGTLIEPVARQLVKMTFVDRMAIFELINLLSLSASNQKKLVTACKELAARHECSMYKILAEQDIQAVVEHPEANNPQKTAQLMALLSEKLLPRLTAANKEFHCFTCGLKLPHGIRLANSPNFERDKVTMTIDFKNKVELQELWPSLAKNLSNRETQTG